MEKPTPLDLVTELTAFLQGELPEGYNVAPELMPRLTQAQADSVVWYLGNLYTPIPDHVIRCDECGQLYDSHAEGHFFDHGRPPHSFCGSCFESSASTAKAREGRRLEKSRIR